jgi:hypothetical protein
LQSTGSDVIDGGFAGLIRPSEYTPCKEAEALARISPALLTRSSPSEL